MTTTVVPGLNFDEPKPKRLRRRSCSRCFYYASDDEKKERYGFCHRYAPEARHGVAHWAKVASWKWCGEFKPKRESAS